MSNKTVLICGSRASTVHMRDFARECVRRAFVAGHSILCGDAFGVDKAVAEATQEYFTVHPDVLADAPENRHLWTLCAVYGLDAAPRHKIVGNGVSYTHLQQIAHRETQTTRSGSRHYARRYEWIEPVTQYRQRDEFMVKQADMIFCIWNGISAGTKHIYEFARENGKPAYLWQFDALGNRRGSVVNER